MWHLIPKKQQQQQTNNQQPKNKNTTYLETMKTAGKMAERCEGRGRTLQTLVVVVVTLLVVRLQLLGHHILELLKRFLQDLWSRHGACALLPVIHL